MKKLSFVLVFVLLFTFLFPCLSSAAVLKDGGYIVLADETDARLSAAGETLSRYLEQITSAEFDVSSHLVSALNTSAIVLKGTSTLSFSITGGSSE